MTDSANQRVNKLLQFRHTLSRDTKKAAPIDMVGGLFPRGYMSIVASMAGAGKTWFTEYICCQLSIGGVILNGLHPKSKPQKCLIFSGETGHEMLDRRLAITDWEFNPANISVYCSIEMGIERVPYMLNTEEGKKNIWTICTIEAPDIIFFDTLISFHSCEENKQGEMTDIYTFLRKIAKAFDCAVVVNHHTRKRPSKEIDRKLTQEDVIGTSSGVRVANAVYIITSEDRDQLNPEGLTRQTVENVKAWEDRIPPFSYTFTKQLNKIDFEIDLEINEAWSKRKRVCDFVSKYMECNSYFSVKSIADQLGMAEETARYYLDKLSEDPTTGITCVYMMGTKCYAKGEPKTSIIDA